MSFPCKFCQSALIYYNELTGEWCEVQTKKKHKCAKPDYANLVHVMRSGDPCTFCHSQENDRAAIDYKIAGEKTTARTTVCSNCVQKLFRVLVQAEEQTF